MVKTWSMTKAKTSESTSLIKDSSPSKTRVSSLTESLCTIDSTTLEPVPPAITPKSNACRKFQPKMKCAMPPTNTAPKTNTAIENMLAFGISVNTFTKFKFKPLSKRITISARVPTVEANGRKLPESTMPKTGPSKTPKSSSRRTSGIFVRSKKTEAKKPRKIIIPKIKRVISTATIVYTRLFALFERRVLLRMLSKKNLPILPMQVEKLACKHYKFRKRVQPHRSAFLHFLRRRVYAHAQSRFFEHFHVLAGIPDRDDFFFFK